MKQYFLVDVDRCWGCKSCMVACKKGHGIAPGPISFVSVFRIETQNADGTVNCDFIPIACQHCSNAACMEKCPKKAIERTEEGLVIINRDKCVGCGICEKSCPYGAISMQKNGNDLRKFPYKCDLCMSRREKGAQTYCEQHCPGRVFTNVDEDNLASKLEAYRYMHSVGQVVYVSNVINFENQN